MTLGMSKVFSISNCSAHTKDAWCYDANGNRTHEDGVQVASYDAQDRLTQYKDNTYQYNALGQLTQKATPGGTETYDYDVFGNLRSVNLANGINIEYLIDPKDRRIGKKVNGAMTQKLLYLGQLNPIAELYPDNSVKNLFIYAGQDAQVSWSTGSTGTTADKSNVPSAMQRYDESGNLTGKYRIIIGSVVMVINAETGDIAQEIEYDVWGNVLSDSNPNFQPFYFAGGLYDTDTKLTRFGARDYDAETGRWTAKDPILFGGGLTSLYDYVGGDPINWIDTTGAAKRKYNKPENPNRRKGAEGRQQSGNRERNIGHKNGEEHSRRSKKKKPGNGRQRGFVEPDFLHLLSRIGITTTVFMPTTLGCDSIGPCQNPFTGEWYPSDYMLQQEKLIDCL